MTISYWEREEAMAAFSGGDPQAIHHLPRDAEFLLELTAGVQILRLLTAHGRTGWSGFRPAWILGAEEISVWRKAGGGSDAHAS